MLEECLPAVVRAGVHQTLAARKRGPANPCSHPGCALTLPISLMMMELGLRVVK